MLSDTDTIAAVATPPGAGAIAVIRVSGPDAAVVASRLFRPIRGGDPIGFGGYTVHYGCFVDSPDTVVDDGLLAMFRAPHSYTGEDSVELSCHGGPKTTETVLRLVLNAGARAAAPGEFTQRAFLNGRLDLAQAEAVADLIRARTESARRVARSQLDGALSGAVGAVRDELVGALAYIEATIDFSDEVGELDYGELERRLTGARERLAALLRTAGTGRLLREGLRVTIAGRPNVGKSSLLNSLLRAERAIVTPIAGTTRDLIEEQADLGGLPVVLVDTAGIRRAKDTIEQIGVSRAEDAIGAGDVMLLVVDAIEGLTADDEALAGMGASQCGHVIAAINKVDAVAGCDLDVVLEAAGRLRPPIHEVVAVSALTGRGVPDLEAALSRLAGTADLCPDSVVVSSARHHQALSAALDSLCRAESTVAERLPGDFVSVDLRGALDQLGMITGETVTEDIIRRIFKDFCVGK